jgi:hypothetical protein
MTALLEMLMPDRRQLILPDRLIPRDKFLLGRGLNDSYLGPRLLPAPFRTHRCPSLIAHPAVPGVAAGRVMTVYVFTKLPNASAMNAMMATQNAYVLTYSIGMNVLTIASTAISIESTNIHIDGA